MTATSTEATGGSTRWDPSMLAHASLRHSATRLSEGMRAALQREVDAGSGSVPEAIAATPALAAQLMEFDLVGQIEAIAACAETDPLVARLVQVDLDARTLLRPEDRAAEEAVVYGLFPDSAPGVSAEPVGGGWCLTGELAGCPHPHALRRAVLVASTSTDRALYEVDLRESGARPGGRPFPIGSPGDPNGSVSFDAVPARRLESAEPWPTGRRTPIASVMRDAACWHGASVSIARALVEQDSTWPSAAERALGLGRVAVAVEASGLGLLAAAAEISGADLATSFGVESPQAPGREEPGTETSRTRLVAERARATTAYTAETVIRQHVLFTDPRGRAVEERVIRRIGYLQVALRRFDRKADLQAIGQLITGR